MKVKLRKKHTYSRLGWMWYLAKPQLLEISLIRKFHQKLFETEIAMKLFTPSWCILVFLHTVFKLIPMLTTDRNFSLREISLYLASLSIHDLSISLCERSSSFSNELYKIKKTISIKVATYFDNHAQSINPQNGFNLNTIVVFMSTTILKKMAYRKRIIPVRTRRATANVVAVQIISKRLQVSWLEWIWL